MSQLQSQSRTKPSESAVMSKAIPIQMTEVFNFDDSFSFLKERFTAEMKRKDEEMSKFNSDLMQLYNESSSTAPTTMTWASLAESPLIQGEGGNMQLKLQFDLSQFDPNEIKVQFMNNLLVVTGAHSEKNDTSSVIREFRREFRLPKGIDPNTVQSFLSKEGVLCVQAPLPQMIPALDTTLLPTQEEEPSKVVIDPATSATPQKDGSVIDTLAMPPAKKAEPSSFEQKRNQEHKKAQDQKSAHDSKTQEKKSLQMQMAKEIKERAAKTPSAQSDQDSQAPQRGLSKTSKK